MMSRQEQKNEKSKGVTARTKEHNKYLIYSDKIQEKKMTEDAAK
jgi:hypothetical protein